MQPTFDQAFQLLNIARESGASLESLQAVYNSGLLSDLLRAKDPCGVNREAFRKLIGLDPAIFMVKMGGPENTDQIMKAWGFAFDERISQTNFPLAPSNSPWEDGIEIVDPGQSFTEEEGLQILKDKGLERPTYEHGIRFAEQHKSITTSDKKPFVIFLHKAWLDSNQQGHVVSVDCFPYFRVLRLFNIDEGFIDAGVLAGVRPRKQP
jgi:hypothetical protein